MPEPVPAWKFYHPLTLWKTLGVFLVTSVVIHVAFAVLRMALKVPVPMWVASGLGGGLSVVIVSRMVAAARGLQARPHDGPQA